MKRSVKFLSIVAIVALSATSMSAGTISTTNTNNVNTTVVGNCLWVTPLVMAFPNYDPLSASATNVTPNGLPHPPNFITMTSPPRVRASNSADATSIAATATSITLRCSAGQRRTTTVSAAAPSGTMTGHIARPFASASVINVRPWRERVS